MCQILFCRSGNPPKEVLEFANERNPHGFGYAWTDDKVVHWKKGFEAKQFEDKIQDFLDKPFPKAIHFRLATHGGISAELSHPFPIKRGNPLALEGEAKSVLFHNGVWNTWDDRLREAIFAGAINPNVLRQPMSDSRAMAILCQRFGPDILDLLEVTHQKVLVLMHDTWYKYGKWTDRGAWDASNSSVERSSGGTVIIAKDRWEKKGVDNKGNLPLTYHQTVESTGGMRYLNAERNEVEEHIAMWGNQS